MSAASHSSEMIVRGFNPLVKLLLKPAAVFARDYLQRAFAPTNPSPEFTSNLQAERVDDVTARPDLIVEARPRVLGETHMSDLQVQVATCD